SRRWRAERAADLAVAGQFARWRTSARRHWRRSRGSRPAPTPALATAANRWTTRCPRRTPSAPRARPARFFPRAGDLSWVGVLHRLREGRSADRDVRMAAREEDAERRRRGSDA